MLSTCDLNKKLYNGASAGGDTQMAQPERVVNE